MFRNKHREDFAFYQRHLPGVFFLLGTGVPEGQENSIDADGCFAYATSAVAGLVIRPFGGLTYACKTYLPAHVPVL